MINRPSTFLLLFISLMGSARAGDLVFTAPGYWCPYTCAAGHDADGFVVDLLRAALKLSGINVRYVSENYSRALADVSHGKKGATGPSYKNEVKGFILPKRPISYNRYCFYTNATTSWQYQGVKSLPAIRLGVTQSYAYSPDIDAYISEHSHNSDRVDKVAGEDVLARSVAKLQKSRIDALIEDRNLVSYFIEKHPGLKLREAGCLDPLFGYVAFSPVLFNSNELARKFDTGMAILLQTGEAQIILRQYGISPQDWLAVTN